MRIKSGKVHLWIRPLTHLSEFRDSPTAGKVLTNSRHCCWPTLKHLIGRHLSHDMDTMCNATWSACGKRHNRIARRCIGGTQALNICAFATMSWNQFSSELVNNRSALHLLQTVILHKNACEDPSPHFQRRSPF